MPSRNVVPNTPDHPALLTLTKIIVDSYHDRCYSAVIDERRVEMPTYKKAQIAEDLKTNKRTITHHADLGLVLPTDPDVTAGRAREWDGQSRIEFGMVQELVNIGVDLKTVRAIMDTMRGDFPGVLRGADDSIKDVVCTDWRTIDGKTKQLFHPIRKGDKLITEADNPEAPKTYVRNIFMGVIRAAAVRRLKG
jgi:hypothetical protein